MKKIFVNLILILIISIISFLTVLSTIGIETNKFNKFISDKASETKNIYLELKTITFKIDPKELSLFLETQNSEITYKGISLPVSIIKVYIDFLSLLKSDPKECKISDLVNLNFEI